MIEAITLEGSNITADIDAYLHHYIYGYSGVIENGSKLAAEIVTNNLIKIKDGLIINQGRFMRINNGTSEDIIIDNGSSGVSRIDLIVAHFETDGIVEKHEIRVIKGRESGAYPNYTTGDIFAGNTLNELPLYAIHLDGINIVNIERRFMLLPSINDIKKGTLFYLGTTDGNLAVGNYEEWMLEGKPVFNE